MVVPLVVPLVDEGLGNCSYLVDLGDGGRWWSTPARPARRTGGRGGPGSRLRFSADTHLHADFLSGARQLAAPTARHPRLRGRRASSSGTPGWPTATRSTSAG